MIKNIVLITSGQPSLNPRLVKEADFLTQQGFHVTVVYQYWSEYATKLDHKLLADKKWNAILVGGTPSINKLYYWSLRIRHKSYAIVARYFSMKYGFAENTIARSNKLLLKEGLKINADLYIAHNLGALPVAVKAAKKNKAKCAFDAEDFHRNEVSNDSNNPDVRLKTFIEDKYLKQTDYITVASPLIYKAYKSLYPNLNPTIINNVFELKHQPKLNVGTKTGLKLFWFSQTIGKNRGLEDVIEALNLINNPLIELHLLGSLSTENTIYFNQLAHFEIKYYHPISSDKIFELAATFDLGLALEQNIPLNRDICLTNKIFTYLISGLAIIASNTQAQKEFMTSNSLIGELYSIGDVTALAGIITKLFNNRDLLNTYRENSYELAKSQYNWEMEKEKFLAIIKSLLS